ncbi:MAG TPA: phosphotransferase [Actinomycetota bacterium]
MAHRFERLARRALDAYALDAARLSLISADWNCTFRLDTTDGHAYALRVYLPLRRRDDEIRSELAWLESLAGVPRLQVPQPLRSRDGSLFVEAEDEAIAERRRVAVFTWVPGRRLGDEPDPSLVSAFGECVARLHEHGRSFRAVQGLRTWDSPFPYGGGSLFDEANAVLVRPSERVVFERAASAAAGGIERLRATGERPRIVHGDLHQDNVFVDGDELWFLDFDDCLLAWPVQDLGVTMWEVGEDEATWPYRDALRAGYERIAPWPERWPGQIDVFAANRGLLKVDDTLRERDGRTDADVIASVRRHAEAIGWFLER